jgi:hypothetical protein
MPLPVVGNKVLPAAGCVMSVTVGWWLWCGFELRRVEVGACRCGASLLHALQTGQCMCTVYIVCVRY